MRHPTKFALPFDEQAPCLVTYAATHRGLHVIGDTTDLDREEAKKFHLFYEGQEKTVRSAFAYAIDEWGEGKYAPVLMGHSDTPLAFSPPCYPLESLQKDVESFGSRLSFEMDMLKFLGSRDPA